MKPIVKWAMALIAIAFIGWVMWGTVARADVACEVCLEFDGERVCRRGAGATEQEARQAAQESACGGNVRGMTEITACRNRPPLSATCAL